MEPQTLYKLTDEDGWTRKGQSNACLWAPGALNTAQKEGTTLCTSEMIHVYEHPLIGAFLDPIHGAYGAGARLWRCEGVVVAREGQLKAGVKALLCVEEATLVQPTRDQRIRFAILSAKQVCTDTAWLLWAKRWLSGEDRSEAAAAWAAEAARAAEAPRAAAAAAWAWAAEAAASFDLFALAEEAMR